MKTKALLLVGSLMLICLALGTTVSAEDAVDKVNPPESKEKQGTDSRPSTNGARFMMRDDVGDHQFEPRVREDTPTEGDFTWNSLTRNSPASGSDPIVGNSKVASFYDFKDGQPHPYYIIKK